MTGRVVLVGAGPGDPDLLTLRALRELETCDVVLYDALIPEAILELIPAGCERIDVGKRGDGSRGIPQDQIAELMLEKAREGLHVVRLKGGDPFVFGRGGEEASALVEAGIPFEIVPGVSSVLAAPAYAGIPVTDRRLSSSVAVVTGHRGRQSEDSRVDWEGLARSAETLIILMGTAWIENIVERVIEAGRAPETPAAVIASGTTPQQRVLTARLCELPRRIREEGIGPPTVIVVGEVVRFHESLAWLHRRPLSGKRVAVLRSEAQGRQLSALLRRRGAEPVSLPLLAFRETSELGKLREHMARAESYDWLVFTSSNAVDFAAPHVPSEARPRVRVACVGPATGASARSAGFSVQITPSARFLPEELAAALSELGTLAGAKVLFPHAERAGDTLPRALKRQGAQVDGVEAYQTYLPAGVGDMLQAAIKEGLDALLLTSPSTVDHLFQLLGEREMEDLANACELVCIGPTTARHLQERGISRGILAQESSDEGLVQALERRYAGGNDGLS